MKKIIIVLTATSSLLLAGYTAHISKITPTVKKRALKGGSWHRGCPVPLSDLRYLTMTYKGFDGRDHKGEMIVNAAVAKQVTQIFGELYKSGYPIRKMRLVSDYHASDFASIEADNTSAFNCRAVTGGTKWSKHSYGRAIDINPLENPYISRSGKIAHKKSLKYHTRKHKSGSPSDKAIIVKGDKIIHLFKSRGWRWGGDWHSIKDYQHFDKPTGHKASIRHPSRKKRVDIKALF